MGSLWVYWTLPRQLPLIMPGLCLKIPRSDTLQMASSLTVASCLQVPVLVKTLWSHSHSTFHDSQSGLCSCSIACPRGGQLPYTVHRSSASTCLFQLQSRGWGQPVATVLSQQASCALSESSATWMGCFKHAECCAALCHSGSTPSWASIPVQGCRAVAT